MQSSQFSKNCKLKNIMINLDYLAIRVIKFFKIMKSKFLQIYIDIDKMPRHIFSRYHFISTIFVWVQYSLYVKFDKVYVGEIWFH